jgi:RNA 2',3'-cyclic 3'-phosphodiesterase
VRKKMNELRVFIAIDLPLPIQLGLDQLITQLKSRKMKAVRWVPVKGIHLTLKFLGNVQAGNLPALTDVLNTAAGSFHQFEFQVGKVGVFPNLRKPRVIWVGIQGPQNLFDLQKAIDLSTRPLGYPGEDRPFSPHLTLGRVSQNASNQEISAVTDTFASFQVGTLGVVNVEAITLFRSELLPTGAVYTPLSEVKLSKFT